jgi:hypothetical protein
MRYYVCQVVYYYIIARDQNLKKFCKKVSCIGQTDLATLILLA